MTGEDRKAVKIPVEGKRNIMVSSALPYVNNIPHLGNIIGCVLSADVFARYCRLRGYNVIYICGTDEYGTSTEIKALQENCSPKEICDNITVIDAKNLTRCKVCKKSPRLCDTDHLFLELPLLKDKVEKYINDMSVVGSWSNNAIKITNARLREGLERYCITRDLKWGVPVPHEKYSNKVFYVWFDAPIGYVSITASYTPDWEKWWKNPENVELYQLMGKDNVSFHSIIFPSTLLGTGENWTLSKTISVTEYLKYESGKFSKSNGIGLFGNDVKDTNIPVEVWRYYLLSIRPETSDADFTWPGLQAKLNSELLSNLGNFINRVLSFIAKPEGKGYNSTIPTVPDDVSGDTHGPTKKLADTVAAYLEQYIEAMEKVNLKQGLKFAMSISHEGNAYLQQTAFWRLYKENLSLCSLVMKTAAGIVFKQLNLSAETHLSLSDDKGDLDRVKRPWDILSAGHKIGTPKALLRELKDEEMEFYMNKYAGSQADRIIRAEAEQIKKIKVSAEKEKRKKAS
ncbi:methionine--tRNA ligase [Trifolium repens]|nr:methionine--tRNA ligase [Trifolium repens]